MTTKFNIGRLVGKRLASLKSFEPIEGTWSGDNRRADLTIARRIAARTGLKVKVELFQENGHALNCETTYGQMLVTRN